MAKSASIALARGPAYSVRATAWIIVAAFLAAYAGLHLLPIPERTITVASDFAYLVPPAFAMIASVVAARATRGKERRWWRMLSVSMGAFLAGELYWALYQVFVNIDGPPKVSPSDIAYLLAYAALIPVAILMTETKEIPALSRVRHAIDLAAMTLWAVVIAYLFIALPLAPGGDVFAVETWPYVLYFCADVGLLLYLLAFSRSRWSQWQWMVAGALVAFALGDASYAFLAGAYATTHQLAGLLDLTWLAGYALVGIAGVHRLSTSGRETPGHATANETELPHWPGFAVQLLALLGIPYCLQLLTRWDGPRSGFVLVATSATALGALIVGRSVVLSVENRRLTTTAITDPLTELFNHRHFHDTARTEVARAARSLKPLSLAVLDIDEFDAVNAEFGHAFGDRVLRSASKALSDNVRTGDLVFRTGGDGFAVLMPETDAVAAFGICARLQDRLSAAGQGVRISASCGIAVFPDHAEDSENLIREADGALYWAQRNPDGRPVIYDPETVDVHGPREHLAFIEEQSHSRMVEVLAAAVDARDPYTQFHSRNVALLVVRLAETIGLEPARIRLLEAAAMLHDVGKIGVPDDILRKSGPLTSEEFLRIREHPALGARILEASTRPELLPWIAAHHERWDGSGYPNGLAGERIPIEARILALCDSFDAMVSDRPYRSAMDRCAALAEIERNGGTQFDPSLTPAFHRFVVEEYGPC